METRISSAAREVIIGDGRLTVLIGERINPTGKKKMAEALQAGNLKVVCQEALPQVDAGADVIDVDVSTHGVDEVTLLPRTVKVVMGVVDVPLYLDSANAGALEAALKIYSGKSLINSVTGEEQSLAKVLPLVKEYKTAVVGLVQDDEGIPNDSDRILPAASEVVRWIRAENE